MINYTKTDAKLGSEIKKGDWIQRAPGVGAYEIAWLTPDDPALPRMAAPSGGGSEVIVYPDVLYVIVDPTTIAAHLDTLTAQILDLIQSRPYVVEVAPDDDEEGLFAGRFTDGSGFIVTIDDD